METNPVEQLDEVQRLRHAAVTEATRTPRGANIVLFVASIVFFSSFAVGNDVTHAAAIVVWTIFVAVWVLWHRSASRVRISQSSERTAREWRREVAEWVGYALLGFLFVGIGDRVSWPLAGVLFAVMSTGAGTVAVIRSVRHAKS